MFILFKNKRIIAFAVILFICSLFYSTLVSDYTLSPRFFILSVLLCVFVLGSSALFKNKLSLNVIHLSLFAYFILNVVSVFWAINPAETWFTSVKTLTSIVVFGISIYFFNNNFRFTNYLSRLAIVVAVVALSLSFVELFEFKLFQLNSIYYITSVSSHKNLLSSFLFLLLPFIIIGALRFKAKSLFFYGLVTISIAVVLYFLQTRTVWLALMAVVLMVCFWFLVRKLSQYSIKTRRIVYSIIVILILLGSAVFIKLLIHNLNNSAVTDTDSIAERVLIWKNTLKIITDNFWFGVGGGNWQVHFPKYSLSGIWRCDELNVTFQRPHNDFLWFFSEFGVVGFILKMIVLIGVSLPALHKMRQSNLNNTEYFEIAIMLSFYYAFAIIMFFDFPAERAEHTIWISIIMAYLYTRSVNFYKPIISLQNIKLLNYALILILIFASYICFLRIKGEYHTREIYIAQQNRELNNIFKHSYLGESFAYTLDPVSMPLNWYCGNALISAQKFNDAFACFKRAYKQNPYNRYVINDLATCYVLKTNYKEAEKLYKEAARISPRYDDALFNLISVYIQLNDYKNAALWEKKLLHDSPKRDYLRDIIYKNK